jgi:glycosyltransferase involved in cell wall biosynthesis
MASSPLSVVIPCRDYGRYLTEAIASVLEQKSSVDCIEVIVINDHSSDPHTLQVLSHWQRADPRVRVVHNDGVPGPAAARNCGITAATGEWIAFLDADDVWLPGALESRWLVAKGHADAQWIGGDFLRRHEDGTLDVEGNFKRRSLTHQQLRYAFETGSVLRLAKPVAEFLRMSLGWTSTIMARKALLLSVGGFHPTLERYEDHHLWIRLASKADFYFVPEVVTYYREHALSISRRVGPPADWYLRAMRLLLQDPRFRPYRALIREKITSLLEQNICYHRARGETGPATLAAAQALQIKPLRIKCWRNLIASVLGRR